MRYRVLIVDDDYYVLERLKKLLPCEELNLEICGEAVNGEEALEIYRNCHPHIVLTDISMPLLNGLDLCKQIIQESPEVRLIVITGFAMMDYAKAVVELGADSLLLKPIEEDELHNAIQTSLDKLQKAMEEKLERSKLKKLLYQSLPLLQERYVLQLVSGAATESEEEIQEHLRFLQLDLQAPCYCVSVICPDYVRLQKKDTEMLQIALKNISQELVEGAGMRCVVVFDALLRGIVISSAQNRKQLQRLGETLAQVQDKLRFHFAAAYQTGIGSMVTSLRELCDSYRSAQYAMAYISVYGSDNVVSFDDLLPVETVEEVSLDRDLEPITVAFRMEDEEGMLHAIRKYVSQAVRKSDGSLSEIKHRCVLAIVYCYGFSKEFGVNIDTVLKVEPFERLISARDVLQVQTCVQDVYKQLLAQYREKKVQKSYRIIKQAKLYIQENLTDPELDLSAVSSTVGLSNSYFSSLFREVAGIGFADYLNWQRIELAKDLLTNTSLKVYEVAEKVGYANSKYFFDVFKRLTGRRPKEYVQSENKK